ncbi:1589_t:CDS:2, partial [Gigaspora margarita]
QSFIATQSLLPTLMKYIANKRLLRENFQGVLHVPQECLPFGSLLAKWFVRSAKNLGLPILEKNRLRFIPHYNLALHTRNIYLIGVSLINLMLSFVYYDNNEPLSRTKDNNEDNSPSSLQRVCYMFRKSVFRSGSLLAKWFVRSADNNEPLSRTNDNNEDNSSSSLQSKNTPSFFSEKFTIFLDVNLPFPSSCPLDKNKGKTQLLSVPPLERQISSTSSVTNKRSKYKEEYQKTVTYSLNADSPSTAAKPENFFKTQETHPIFNGK